MQLHGIYIDHFLSFDSFKWDDLDGRLNVIVGPNGAGKTNLFHAVHAVYDALTFANARQSIWARQAHRLNQERPIEIALDIEFDTEAERALIATFFAAAFCNEQLIRKHVSNALGERLWAFSEMVKGRFLADSFSWIRRGRLVARCDGQSWRTWYASYDEQSVPFYLAINSTRGQSTLHGSGSSTPNGTPSLYHAWVNPMREVDRIELVQYLTAVDGLYVDCPLPDVSAIPLLAPEDGVLLEVQRPLTAPLPIIQTLEKAVGINLIEQNQFNLPGLFQVLMERSFVFTENVRAIPLYQFSEDEIDAPRVELSDGSRLPLYLLQMMTGSPEEQRRFQRIKTLFRDLTGLEVEVSRPRKRSQPHQGPTGPKPPTLSVSVVRDWGPVPLEYSGAGITEAIFLSAIISGGGGQLMLLDEPASNLHPTMQTRLVGAIREHTGYQFMISTHSPHMVPADAIDGVSRFYLFQEATRRRALSPSTSGSKLGEQLGQVLRGNTDARAMLFQRAALLVEGGSELQAVPIWFSKLHYSLADRDIAMYGVNGDEGFATIVAFLHQMGIPWAIICDGKIMSDPQPPGVNLADQLRSAGIANVPVLDGLDFVQRRDALAPFGVFTFANSFSNEIEDLPDFKKHLGEAKQHAGRSKSRRAYYIARHFDAPPEVVATMENVRQHLRNSGLSDA